LDYDDALGFDNDVIDNDDRDSEDPGWMVRAGYQFRTEMQAFASYTGNSYEYDQNLDRNGYARSGDGYSASAGVGFTATGKLNGQLYATYASRSYDDPRLPETSGWAVAPAFRTPTYPTRRSSRWPPASRKPPASTARLPAQSPTAARGSRTAALRADQRFCVLQHNDYQLLPGAPASARAWDHIWRAGVGASWFIHRHFFLNASYDFETLTPTC
jgi:hypothetical protein